ncbi:hypothetical protein EYF80_028666 [Liparis tanakae]|uniref:Uncharacterized protein n=1 Tax=Liparis tanakae TaxID=230148 RepID=A0A4Z2H5L1_9TELE|nr:hypothetical protein EYF80_028666 [Liparis tanakae]
MKRPHHHSLLVASTTSMTSPALKPSSWSSMVTWSQRASAYTTLPSLISCKGTGTEGWTKYVKASRNISTTLMTMSSIMMRNTTTFCVSGGRLQRSTVVKKPSRCRLHRPEPPPPRAISRLLAAAAAAASSSSSSSSSAPLPLPRRRLLSLSAEPPHHTAN